MFQSPDGDSLCPDDRTHRATATATVCFSPLTGILYVRTRVANQHRIDVDHKFQSPDGDSLCPDVGVHAHTLPWGGGFSPLTGILYVRTFDFVGR